MLDSEYTLVTVDRYRCVACRRTFCHYPSEVHRAHQTQRLEKLAALLEVARAVV